MILFCFASVQVSVADNARKYSTHSKAFWEETTQMLQDLSILRSEVSDLSCPCDKPTCPFKHDARTSRNPRRGTNVSFHEQSPRMTVDTPRVNEYLTPSARQNVATYLASMRPTHERLNALIQRDCLVTEEPFAAHDKVYFVRSSPSRKAQRKHSTALKESNSYPSTMNSLRVPLSCLEQGIERRHSLPNVSDCHLGSSLDSLDSDKMQDIQRSFLREKQRHHLSNIEW